MKYVMIGAIIIGLLIALLKVRYVTIHNRHEFIEWLHEKETYPKWYRFTFVNKQKQSSIKKWLFNSQLQEMRRSIDLSSNNYFLQLVQGETGYDFEQYFGQMLKDYGSFKNVTVTRGSGDFGLDIIVDTNDGKRLGFQMKRYKNNVGVAAVQQAVSGGAYYHCNHTFVVTTSAFTKSAIQMAAKTDCQLISGMNILKGFKQIISMY